MLVHSSWQRAWNGNAGRLLIGGSMSMPETMTMPGMRPGRRGRAGGCGRRPRRPSVRTPPGGGACNAVVGGGTANPWGV